MSEGDYLIGVLSDTHGRDDLAELAAGLFAEHRVRWVFHCGDIGDIRVVDALLAKNLTVNYVFGNTDHDRPAMRRYIQRVGATVADPFAECELAGRKIAVLHGDDHRLLGRLIDSQAYDFLLHGHTHLPRDETVGRTRVLNPGALHRSSEPMIMLVELGSGQVRRLPIRRNP